MALMRIDWTVTDAGAAAFGDATETVELQSIRLGSGLGAPSRTLADLRAPVETGPLRGTDRSGTVRLVAAHFAGAPRAYDATEAGLFAALSDGRTVMVAHWSAADADGRAVARGAGARLTLAALIDDAGADATVTVAARAGAALALGGYSPFTSLSDTPAALGAASAGLPLRVRASGDGVEARRLLAAGDIA